MDNSPGRVVEMERNKVDDNKDQTCSTGLHFCGLSYLGHFGGSDSRIVIVKINPRDVVSIPSDYNGAKGRACRYEVIGEMGVSAEEAFDKPVQSNANGTKTVPVESAKPAVDPRVAGLAQEYDKDGRPLSMTWDAVRKRRARAAAKAHMDRKVQFNPAPKATDWPFPKGSN
jgi:hypothetical protein